MKTPTVTILVPVWKRPQNLAPLIDSIDRSVALEDADVTTLFLASPGDTEEIAELERLGCWHEIVPFDTGPGNYTKKINHGLRITDADWLLTAADDLRFHPGWVRACISAHIKTGCRMIGTNDLHNPTVIRGQYATHLFVQRDYAVAAVADEPGNLFCEKYDHCCVDTEACDTARSRKQFAPAPDAHVEHLHPSWRGAVDDEVYAKGRLHHRDDRRLYMRRRHLWTKRIVKAHYRPAPASVWPPR